MNQGRSTNVIELWSMIVEKLDSVREFYRPRTLRFYDLENSSAEVVWVGGLK